MNAGKAIGSITQIAKSLLVWAAVAAFLAPIISAAVLATGGHYQRHPFGIAIGLSATVPVLVVIGAWICWRMVSDRRCRAEQLTDAMHHVRPLLRGHSEASESRQLAAMLLQSTLKQLAESLAAAVLPRLPQSSKEVCFVYYDDAGKAAGWPLSGYPQPRETAARIAQHFSRAENDGPLRGCVGTAVERNETIVVLDRRHPPEDSGYVSGGVAARHYGLMCAPVEVVGTHGGALVIGALCVSWEDPPRGFGQFDRYVLEHVAIEVADICGVARALYALELSYSRFLDHADAT